MNGSNLLKLKRHEVIVSPKSSKPTTETRQHITTPYLQHRMGSGNKDNKPNRLNSQLHNHSNSIEHKIKANAHQDKSSKENRLTTHAAASRYLDSKRRSEIQADEDELILPPFQRTQTPQPNHKQQQHTRHLNNPLRPSPIHQSQKHTSSLKLSDSTNLPRQSSATQFYRLRVNHAKQQNDKLQVKLDATRMEYDYLKQQNQEWKKQNQKLRASIKELLRKIKNNSASSSEKNLQRPHLNRSKGAAYEQEAEKSGFIVMRKENQSLHSTNSAYKQALQSQKQKIEVLTNTVLGQERLIHELKKNLQIAVNARTVDVVLQPYSVKIPDIKSAISE